jgi:flagellar biosynthesis protein FlhG
VTDQAAGLRELAFKKNGPTKMIAVTSGKGGVGKSNMVINLAIALAELRRRVLIVDVDLGLANVEALLGIASDYNVQHVIDGLKRLEDIMVTGPSGIRIIPGSSGMSKLADLTSRKRQQFIEHFSSLQGDVDIILVDTMAGISRNVVGFAVAADEVLLVTTPEPTAVLDAYATIKTIFERQPNATIKLVVNMVKDERQAMRIAQRIESVVKQFLNRRVRTVGCVPHDHHLTQAVMKSRALMQLYPNSPAAKSVKQLAGRLVDFRVPLGAKKRRGLLERLVAGFGMSATE